MATSDTYPLYEAKVGALGSVRAWRMDGSYCFTFFNGYDYTPLFLSEEAAYYTWAFLSMMHPEAQFVLDKPSIKTKANKCKPAKKKPTVKKRQVKAK
jgi:hypothetical protein